jgi:nickel-dependent lactate racemase
MENSCRQIIEEVAKKAGLKFIVNVVLDPDNQVMDIVAGDVIKAHREGALIARNIYGIPIDEPAEIVITSSAPYDIDYWQCEKALISSYSCVKEGGIVIFAGPCLEGLAHNHDDLLSWFSYTYQEASQIVKAIKPFDDSHDLVAAGIAMGATLVGEKARIFIVTEGLTDEQILHLGYTRFPGLQEAVNAALNEIPKGKVLVLPRGGDCMPYLKTGQE